MNPVAISLQIIAGIAGSHLAAMVRPRRGLGPRLNTALGAIAGVAGGSLLGGVFGRGTWPMIASASLTGAVLVSILGVLRGERPTAHPMPEPGQQG
ncbi:MAG: hypothetical protein JNJ98_13460 [Gemmatimonadetes bacterium]|nr:hypothetical protein [Gemmatimonadota bacterium]